MSDITYQVNSYNRVSGIPFPIVLWEPSSLGSEQWVNFEGLFTIISPILNACYLSLLIVAMLLALPEGWDQSIFILMVLINGLKHISDKRKKG